MNFTLLSFISGALILLGTFGSIIPLLPGLPLAFLGLVLFAWFTKAVSIWAIGIFAVLILCTIIVDVFAPALAAKGKKASRYGVIGAMIGGVLGIFVFGPIGVVLGPFLGAFVGEIISSHNPENALQVALNSMLGTIISSVFKLIVGFSMFIYFVVVLIQTHVQ